MLERDYSYINPKSMYEGYYFLVVSFGLSALFLVWRCGLSTVLSCWSPLKWSLPPFPYWRRYLFLFHLIYMRKLSFDFIAYPDWIETKACICCITFGITNFYLWFPYRSFPLMLLQYRLFQFLCLFSPHIKFS